MSVHNYLRIDRLCVGYTERSDKTLLAVKLCRQNEFYEVYLSLSIRRFNSFFITLSFPLDVHITITVLSLMVLSLRQQSRPRNRLKLILNSGFGRAVLRSVRRCS